MRSHRSKTEPRAWRVVASLPAIAAAPTDGTRSASCGDTQAAYRRLGCFSPAPPKPSGAPRAAPKDDGCPPPRRPAAASPRQWGPPGCHGASAGGRRQAGSARCATRPPRPRRPLQPRRAQEGPSAGMRRPPPSPASPLSRRLSLSTPTQHRLRATPHPGAARRAAVASCCRPPVMGDGQPLRGGRLWTPPRRRRLPRCRRGQRTTGETAAVQRWAKIGGGGA